MAREILLPDPFPALMQEIEAGAVPNLFGEPGSGKTNLCLLAALHCIRNGGAVTFIDTEGGFSFKRLEQLYPQYKLILGKIDLREPKTFQEQGKLIRSLEGTDFVIVDSLSALYRVEYAEHEPVSKPHILEANKELSRQLSLLSAHARRHSIPVLVTSHAFRNWDTGRMEMVGGDAVRYWSKTILFLEKTGKQGERRATLVKHRSLPEGESAKFLIVQDGIRPAGFRLF